MTPSPTVSVMEITSDRLILRRAHDTDREGIIELQTDPQVREYLGGPVPRGNVEQHLDAAGTASVTAKPGTYVIADNTTNRLIGLLILDRRSTELPGHVIEAGDELELSYQLRRCAWGAGLAFEAATALLRAAAAELPDQPVLVVTQTANQRSMRLAARLGFHHVTAFEQFGAEQTLSTAQLHSFRA